MTDSTATYTRSVVCDLPDRPAEDIVFKLITEVAIASTEVFPVTEYTLTLDANGQGTQILPVPDNTGAASWYWRITTPDDNPRFASLAYDASSIQLSTLLASALSSETAASLADQFVAVAGDTMTGQLNFSGTDHAGIKLLSLTTTERDALTPAEGMVIYNETTTTVQAYEGGSWLDIGSGTSDAGGLVIDVRNDSGGDLTAGTPVYITGYNVGQELVTVDKADASSGSTMPYIAVVETATISNNTNGTAIVNGRVANFDTSSFSVGNELYVSETAGTFTTTSPAGTALAQKIAVVLRSHATLGIIQVFGTGSSGEFVHTTGDTMSGTLAMADNLITRPVIKDYGETHNAIGSIGGGTQDIDLTLGNDVSATVDTSTTTFTFSNPPASGTAGSFTLELTNGGSQTVNWPASVDWAGGTEPELTVSGYDILTFRTRDGGTTWQGFAAGLAMA